MQYSATLKHLRQYLSKIGRTTVLVITGLALAAGPILGPSRADLFTSYAAPAIEHTAKAEALGKLNMLTKSSKGFELERPATRLEAVDTVIRLLGKTAEIKAGVGTFSHPFTDVPAQGADAVGYLFTNGYLSDNAAHTFKPGDKMDMNTYCAMLLRAMGYKIENGDYTWATAVDFAVKAGLLNANEVKLIKAQGTQGLMRDELALMSYNALKAPLNPAVEGYKGKSLVDLGIEAKAIYTESAVMAGIAKMATYDGSLRKPMYEVTYTGIELDGIDQSLSGTVEHKITGADGTASTESLSTSLDIAYEADYPQLMRVANYVYENDDRSNVESFAEVAFFKAGKLVMSASSDVHCPRTLTDTTTGYYITAPKIVFDEVQVKYYQLTMYELFRKYGNIPVYTYTFKQAKDGISKLKTATYVNLSRGSDGTVLGNLSIAGSLYSGLNNNMVQQPGKTPFIVSRVTDIKGRDTIENDYMLNIKLVGKKLITLTKSNTTAYLSRHYTEKHQLMGEYTLYLNPKETAYFILRDAKYNPIGAVCFKP